MNAYDFAAVDLAGGVSWPGAVGEGEPPVPVDVEDVEQLVALERGAVPIDVLVGSRGTAISD